MGGLSIWHWLIVLLIIVLVFGTKKLKNMGEDLGGAVKGFKQGMRDGGDGPASATSVETPKVVADRSTIDVETRDRTRT